MITDFHTHTFPEKIAGKALDNLSKSAVIPYYTDGTNAGIKASMKEAGIDLSVILPVVTRPQQTETVNRVAIELNGREEKEGGEQRLISFGGIHPENDNYKEVISMLAANGVKGIKLHPVFQGVYLDDLRFKRIVSCAMEQGLWIITHAGFDLTYPDLTFSDAAHIEGLLKDVRPDKFILAHMGGYGCWNEIERIVAEYPVYIDTAFTVQNIGRYTGAFNEEREAAAKKENCDSWFPAQADISDEQFLRLVNIAGADRVLFGSDSPWTGQKFSLYNIRRIIKNEADLTKILGLNAARILGIKA